MGSLLSPVLALGAALYTLASVAHLFYLFRRGFEGMARWSTRSAWVVHTVGLVLLLVHTRRAPLWTVFEFAYFFSWLLASGYIVYETMRDNQTLGAFLVTQLAIIQVGTVALPIPSPGHSPLQQLPASLIGWHIGVTMLGYGCFMASFVAGALYLLQERNLRLKRWGPAYYRLPSLESLDIWGGRFVSLGFPLMTIGVTAGLFFAHFNWKTIWSSDPKVIFTAFAWLVYGGYLLMRQVWGWGGRKAAWWSVAGVVVLMINYFVINLISGLHSYGV